MQLIYSIIIVSCLGVLPILFGIYSLIAGNYMYRTDKHPSYFNEPNLMFGSPRKMGVSIIIRGVFAIIFGLIVVLTTILQG
jgi:hypothetical protein